MSAHNKLSNVDAVPVTLLRPSRGWGGINIAELWRYRELVYFLIWRDIKVRYKQTLLGAAWAILKPFLSMIIFSIIFGQLAGLPNSPNPDFELVYMRAVVLGMQILQPIQHKSILLVSSGFRFHQERSSDLRAFQCAQSPFSTHRQLLSTQPIANCLNYRKNRS